MKSSPHQLIHSSTHLLIHSFTHPLIYSSTHLLIHSSTHPLYSILFTLSYDRQGKVGDEIEHHPHYLVQCNKRVEHRVGRFPGYIEESVVYRVYPFAGKDTNQGRAEQYYPVNNRAPQKKCSDCNDIHSISPSFYVTSNITVPVAKPYNNDFILPLL